jgi:hypothetical protein
MLLGAKAARYKERHPVIVIAIVILKIWPTLADFLNQPIEVTRKGSVSMDIKLEAQPSK